MKAKVAGLVQKAQGLVKEVTAENETLEKTKEEVAEHYSGQQAELSKAYESAVKGLMDKRKQLSDVLKHSLSEQKSALTKQKAQICQRIEQALTASDKLSRFAENMDNLAYEDYQEFVENAAKEISELETYLSSLGRIEVTYMQFHEDIVISDKSEIFPAETPPFVTTNATIPSKKKLLPQPKMENKPIGLTNLRDNPVDGVNDSIEKIVFHETTTTAVNNLNSEYRKAAPAKRKPAENGAAAGAKTSRYGKPSPKMEGSNEGAKFFSPDGNSGSQGQKGEVGLKKAFGRTGGVTNPFVEECLLAKMAPEKKLVAGTPKEGERSKDGEDSNKAVKVEGMAH